MKSYLGFLKKYGLEDLLDDSPKAWLSTCRREYEATFSKEAASKITFKTVNTS